MHVRVMIISRPSIDIEAIRCYLESIGGVDWLDNIGGPDGEILAEFAGRLCYKSWVAGLNPNVTRIRKNRKEYLENILKQRHGSILEHINYTFLFTGISRICTHELVRHRAGVAISQESQRYVRYTGLPDIVLGQIDDQDLLKEIEDLMQHIDRVYSRGAKLIDGEGSFSIKKSMTSDLRRILPQGITTAVLWTANVRALRHIIEMRTSRSAEWEIRQLFDRVARLMIAECPLLFGDFELNESGEWVPKYGKV